MQGKSDSTERNADLRDWYRSETCLQILSSAGAVSLKLTDIRLHTWRNLFWTGIEKSATDCPSLATKTPILTKFTGEAPLALQGSPGAALLNLKPR